MIKPYSAIKKIIEFFQEQKFEHFKTTTHKNILSTKPINTSGQEAFELHMIACERDFPMSLWALKSFYHYSQTHPQLVIHNDGSLSATSKKIYYEHFKGCRMIEREEADQGIDEALKDYPLCRELRKNKRFYCSLKLFDSFHFCQNDYLFHMDSDMLFFQKPKELLNHICAKQPFFMSDYQDSFSFEPELLNKLFSVTIERHANAGLFFMPKKVHFDNLVFIENYFREAERLNFDGPPNRHEQTLNVLILSKLKAARLSTSYQISRQPLTDETAMHHYVNDGSRILFYLKGLKYLKKNRFLKEIRS